jgi:hypothetical protein
MVYSIYTILNGIRFYFDRYNVVFTAKPITYFDTDELDLLCTLIEATVKTSEMREALAAIDMSKYKLKLHIA